MAQKIIAEYAYGTTIKRVEYKASQVIPCFIWVPNPCSDKWIATTVLFLLVSLSYNDYETNNIRSFFGPFSHKVKGSKIKEQLLILKLAGI